MASVSALIASSGTSRICEGHGYLQICLVLVCALGTFLATAVVLIHLLVRKFVMEGMKKVDLLLVVAWILFVGYCVLNAFLVPNGVGVEQPSIQKDCLRDLQHVSQTERSCWQLADSQKLVVGSQIYYAGQMIIVKTSIGILYLNMFCPRGVRRTGIPETIWTVIVINAAWYITSIVLKCLTCDNWVGHSSCLKISVILILSAATNFFSDVAVFLVPYLAVKTRQIPMARKRNVYIVSRFGLLVIAASGLRLGLAITSAGAMDATVADAQMVMCTVAELSLGITSATMPSMVSAWNHVRKGRRLARSRQVACVTGSLPLITDAGYWMRGGRAGHHRRPSSLNSPKRLYHEAFHDILHTKCSGDLENRVGSRSSRGGKRIKCGSYHNPDCSDNSERSRGRDTTATHILASPVHELHHTPNRYAGRPMPAGIEVIEHAEIGPDPLEKIKTAYWANGRHSAPTTPTLLTLPIDL